MSNRLNICESDIIKFNRGIPGFLKEKEFVLLDVEENKNFKLLRSVEDGNLGFVVVSPFAILKDYEISLDKGVIDRLCIEDSKDVILYSTVTFREDITTNLSAPIVINLKNNLGEQVILEDSKYMIKHPIDKE